MATDVTKLEWSVGERKKIDYPIECFDSDMQRIVVARVPIGKKTNADDVARLIASTTKLLSALERLAFAAECRDNTSGDPLRLIAVKAELADAARHANEVIAKATGVTK